MWRESQRDTQIHPRRTTKFIGHVCQISRDWYTSLTARNFGLLIDAVDKKTNDTVKMFPRDQAFTAKINKQTLVSLRHKVDKAVRNAEAHPELDLPVLLADLVRLEQWFAEDKKNPDPYSTPLECLRMLEVVLKKDGLFTRSGLKAQGVELTADQAARFGELFI